MKRVAVLLCMLGTFLMIPACSIQKNSTERLRDLEFTVVKEEDIPKMLEKLFTRDFVGRFVKLGAKEAEAVYRLAL